MQQKGLNSSKTASQEESYAKDRAPKSYQNISSPRGIDFIINNAVKH